MIGSIGFIYRDRPCVYIATKNDHVCSPTPHMMKLCRLTAGAGRASRGERRPRSSMVHWARVLTLTLTVNLNTDPALATDPDPSLSPSSSPHQVGGWAAAAMRDRCPSRGERGARGGAVRPTAPWRSRMEGRPAQPGLCAVELRRAHSNVYRRSSPASQSAPRARGGRADWAVRQRARQQAACSTLRAPFSTHPLAMAGDVWCSLPYHKISPT